MSPEKKKGLGDGVAQLVWAHQCRAEMAKLRTTFVLFTLTEVLVGLLVF